VDAWAREFLLEAIEDASSEVDGADEFVGAHVVRQIHDQIVDLREAGDQVVRGAEAALEAQVQRVGSSALAIDVVVGHIAMDRRTVSRENLFNERVGSHAKVSERLDTFFNCMRLDYSCFSRLGATYDGAGQVDCRQGVGGDDCEEAKYGKPENRGRFHLKICVGEAEMGYVIK
jgi:hypothetical protein